PERIGLRRPPEAVDGARPVPLARGVQLVDRDDLARARLGQEILVLKTPPRGSVAAEALPRVPRVRARPRAHVQDAHLEHVAGLGPAHGDRPRADVHALPLTRATAEPARVHRSGTAAVHTLALPVPAKDALRAGIAPDHALGVVIGVVGQDLDRHGVARAHLE